MYPSGVSINNSFTININYKVLILFDKFETPETYSNRIELIQIEFVITLFYGSFNNFEKNIFFGSKTAKLGTKNLHFQYKSVFSSAKQQIQVDPI